MNRLKIAACVLSVVQIVAIVVAVNGSEIMQEALKVWLVILIVGGLVSGCLKARSQALDREKPVYVARRISRQRFEQQMGSLFAVAVVLRQPGGDQRGTEIVGVGISHHFEG